MSLFLLGLLVGFVTIAVPGPIAVSLVQVSVAKGRSSGIRAALGIASADALLAGVSIAVVTAGAGMAGSIFAFVQLLTAGVLVGIGLLLVLRPVRVQETAATVRHPLRAFLAITALMPSAIGGWLAMLAALPFADNPASLTAFAAGVVLTSFLWHPLVGLSAGSIGGRLTPRMLRVGTRLGGVATALLGLAALMAW